MVIKFQIKLNLKGNWHVLDFRKTLLSPMIESEGDEDNTPKKQKKLKTRRNKELLKIFNYGKNSAIQHLEFNENEDKFGWNIISDLVLFKNEKYFK